MGFHKGQEAWGPQLTTAENRAATPSRAGLGEGQNSPHWAWAVAIWEGTRWFRVVQQWDCAWGSPTPQR